jgi:hypothetical protein
LSPTSKIIDLHTYFLDSKLPFAFIFLRLGSPFLNFIAVFVLFALGADDVFVAVDKWKNARIDHPDATTEQISIVALPDAAFSMLQTSVCSIHIPYFNFTSNFFLIHVFIAADNNCNSVLWNSCLSRGALESVCHFQWIDDHVLLLFMRFPFLSLPYLV